VKVLIAGSNVSGSWKIRGEQLGRAIDAAVISRPRVAIRFDVVILVKRPDPAFLANLHSTFKVWDIVDAWPQPVGNSWDRDRAMTWLREQIRTIRPNAIVAATRKMAEDCEEFDIPTLWLPHHGRPNSPINPIRSEIRTVGYEGGGNYLGAWSGIIERQCKKRGWKFVINPAALADLDIVLGLREVAGYPARNWKSNVKLANAQITGTPCALSPEAGYVETGSGAEFWAETENHLKYAFDSMGPLAFRSWAHHELLKSAPTIENVSLRYKEWLQQLKY
jgi:hypothetical protein